MCIQAGAPQRRQPIELILQQLKSSTMSRETGEQQSILQYFRPIPTTTAFPPGIRSNRTSFSSQASSVFHNNFWHGITERRGGFMVSRIRLSVKSWHRLPIFPEASKLQTSKLFETTPRKNHPLVRQESFESLRAWDCNILDFSFRRHQRCCH